MPSYLLPLLSLLWGVHTWQAQQEAGAKAERERLNALYGNPFLLACDELQSRIWNLIGGTGTFDVLRAHYPDNLYAVETVYLILQYFGWERHTYRYGPYSEDADVIRLTAAIRDDFATAQSFPEGPFCFFRTEQRALGEMVIKQVASETGPSDETISLFDLRTALASPPFSDSRAIEITLKALTDATSGDTLEGRERLSKVQNDLVDLVDLLETRLGVTLVPYTRGKLPVSADTPPQRGPVLLAVPSGASSPSSSPAPSPSPTRAPAKPKRR